MNGANIPTEDATASLPYLILVLLRCGVVHKEVRHNATLGVQNGTCQAVVFLFEQINVISNNSL